VLVYRLAKTKYIQDLTGTGARLYGGRWNHKGTSMVYTATSRSLATVEFLVHVPLSLLPRDLSIATLHIPDTLISQTLAVSALPPEWRTYPGPVALADLGTAWATSLKTLLLQVPSVVVEHEWNMLMNPLHPDMVQVEMAHVDAYTLDNRLLRSS
jgi:RES domain-containing protein